jgi:hypothetical protein
MGSSCKAQPAGHIQAVSSADRDDLLAAVDFAGLSRVGQKTL